MPLFIVNKKLVYFAHVPRCAGSAIEDYVQARFGEVGFLDRLHLGLPGSARWNQTSPQHIDAKTLERFMPLSLFAHVFTVVRHPVDRMVSVFRFQRDILKCVDPNGAFDDWLRGLKLQFENVPFGLDNHPRPMTDLVPETAKVFRLEDGLGQLINWFDAIAGDVAEPRGLEPSNSYKALLDPENPPVGPEPQVTDSTRALITDIYAADFKRFGYDSAGGGEP